MNGKIYIVTVGSSIMRRYTTLGKSIWVIITRGYGNHKCNIEFITSGRRPRVINSILHK